MVGAPGHATRTLVVLTALSLVLASAAAWRVYSVELPGGVGHGALRALRWTRVEIAVVVGAGLAAAGVLLQGLLRNPLASPDLLALAPGAGLGIMTGVFVSTVRSGALAEPGVLGASGSALAGAMGALAVVYAASQRRGWLNPTTLVLVGVVVGLACGAGVTLLQSLMPDQGYQASRMLIGSLREDTPAAQIRGAGVAVLACVIVSAACGPWLDGAAMSDDEARSVGVPLRAMRVLQFVCAGVLTALSVLLAGPIGFVGLVCPHVVRGLIGPRHRWLVVGSALCGAGVMVLADIGVEALRGWMPGFARLPLGVVTTMLGAPIFVWMLRRQGAEG
jgi:iron complex transport system permease protein